MPTYRCYGLRYYDTIISLLGVAVLSVELEKPKSESSNIREGQSSNWNKLHERIALLTFSPAHPTDSRGIPTRIQSAGRSHGRQPAHTNDHLSIFSNKFSNFYNIINIIIKL
jgi:hypothetical protein